MTKQHIIKHGLPGGSHGKEFAYNMGDLGSIPGSGIPQRRESLPTPVFLPGKIYRLEILEGCSPKGCKKSEVTKGLSRSHRII